MKYIFRFFLLIAAIVAFFAFIGAMLPRGYDFAADIEIAAPASEIFPKINSLPVWQDWSMQWNPDVIEGLEIQYNQPTKGKGAAQTWTDSRGDGKLWITASSLDQSVDYKMIFANFPEMESQFLLESSGEDKTKVTWSSKGSLPSGPFYGYFGSFFSTHMKSEYDKSLGKLKEIVEAESDL